MFKKVEFYFEYLKKNNHLNNEFLANSINGHHAVWREKSNNVYLNQIREVFWPKYCNAFFFKYNV